MMYTALCIVCVFGATRGCACAYPGCPTVCVCVHLILGCFEDKVKQRQINEVRNVLSLRIWV